VVEKEYRERRDKRIWELRQAGLSEREISARLKEEGWRGTSDSTVHTVLNQSIDKKLDPDYVIPFYCGNKTATLHGICCFNHKIGMPEPDAVFPPHQLEIFEAIGKNDKTLIVKGRRIGATDITLRAILYYSLYGFLRGLQTIIVPGTQIELAVRWIRQLRVMLEKAGMDTEIDYDLTKRGTLTLKNGAEMMAIASNAQLLRGQPKVGLVFLDEAAHFDMQSPTAVMDAVEPAVANTKGHLVAISTPKGKRGFFYGLTLDKDNGWIKYYYPSEVAVGHSIKPGWLEAKMKERHTNMDFEQEFHNAFSTPQNSVYSAVFIKNIQESGNFDMIEVQPGEFRLKEPRTIDKAFAGLDIARVADFSALVILGRNEKKWYPVLIKIFPHITWPTMLIEIERLYREFHVVEIAADKTSLGQGFIDFVVAKNMRCANIGFTMASKSQMINHAVKLFQSQELFIPKSGCDEIIKQFGEQMQTDTGVGMRYSHPEGSHDDAFWAFHLAAQAVGEGYEQYAGFV